MASDERWQPVGITHEGGLGFTLNGVSVRDPRWQPQHRSVSVVHPQYPQQVYRGSVFAWHDADPPLLLAIAEVSMNVYAFAVSPPSVEVARG